jgi:uncharacterized protein (TIGR03437 family)
MKSLRFAAFTSLILLSFGADAQQASRVSGRIENGGRRVALAGRIHRKATPQNDLGRVNASFELPAVTVMLKPTAAGQAALSQFLQEQQDPASPNFHRWLTPDEYGARFGASESDVQQIADWLKSQGLTVETVARGRNWITVRGTADQVGKAFGTEIHRYKVDGETHFANSSAPTVPAALAGVVGDVMGLHDFHAKPRLRRPDPRMNSANGVHHLAPDDIAAIYNIAPLYAAGIDGTGMSIAIMGESPIRTSDIDAFRAKFNLPPINLQQVPACGRHCPGLADGGVLDEAHLDIEWTGAVARNANIFYVYANDVYDAVRYAVNNNVAKVMSVSFGGCEQADFVTPFTLQQVAQQANAQGITWFNASGDAAAADCDDTDAEVAQNGFAVDIPAAIPEVTGVGGTTFYEQGNEWAATNTANSASATGYIRERVWNDSSFSISGGGGGTSVIFGRPSWQTGPGVPNDGVRHVPDVSFASSPNHDNYYFYSGGVGYVGGTSVAAPVMAGIATLLNHYLVSTGAAQQPGLGNINPALYRLAQTTTGVFHDVVDGDNAVQCAAGSPDCVNGVFGHKAGPGYDNATGLGSIDAYNLAQQWSAHPAISSAVVVSVDQRPVFQTAGVWQFALTLTEEAGIGTKVTDFTIDGVSHASEIEKLFGSANLQPRKFATANMTLNSIAAPKNVVLGFKGVDASGTTWSTELSVPFQGVKTPLAGAGFSNAASGQQVYAPGMIMSVYGAGMANSAQAASAIPLPSYMAGFEAWVNGVPAPLYYVSPNQVNIQIPYETQPGSATLELGNPYENVQYRFTVGSTGPGVFTFGDGFVNPSRTARRGDVATLFVTGEGLVTPSLATGATPSSNTSLSRLPKPRANVTVTVGGVAVTPDFVGIPSGLVGVTQINFRIPTTVAAGPQDVVVTVGSNASNTAKITVQ